MKKNKWFLSFLLTVATVVLPKGTEASPISPTAPVDGLIDKLRNSISELVSETESSATVVGFSFATDANLLLQNLNLLAQETSGQVFRDLNQTQQATFSSAFALLDQGERSLEKRLEQMQTIVSSFGGEISRLPLASKRPLLNSFRPSFVMSSGASYDLKLQGSLLAGHNASLFFGTTSCKRVSSVESGLRFSCPGEIFDSEENQWMTGQLKMTKTPPWYAVWKDPQVFSYSLGVMAIPEHFGDFTLKFFEKRTKTQRVSRQASNRHRNDHCSSSRSKTWTYRPASACYVDVRSIDVSERHSRNSTYEGIVNASRQGFQVRGVVRNHGTGGPGCIPRDARGSLNVTARWVDVCESSEEAVLPEVTGKLDWNNEKAFELPEDLTKFLLTIRQVDGQTKVFDQGEPSRWYIVSFDPTTKVLLVKPRAIEEAFR